jgi:hypothetical protein
METKARAKLEAETGATFEQWVARARRAKIGDARAMQEWLKSEHGHGSRVAGWIASAALAEDEPDYGNPEELVDALYSGTRAALRPVHEALVDELLGLGTDVLVTACKTMVPAYRKFVFAELRPTRAGVGVRLALGDARTGARLRAAKASSPDDRMTREVVVASSDEIDAELRAWLTSAYAAGAKKAERKAAAAVPKELAAALERSKSAAATWAECTPAMRRDMVAWITGARQAATREKRLATAVEKLESGRRRIY